MLANTSTANTPGVLSGLIGRPELGQQINRGERTIIRYERAGMPVIVMGMLRLYDPLKVREWLLSHERSHGAPRRGRPTKKAA